MPGITIDTAHKLAENIRAVRRLEANNQGDNHTRQPTGSTVGPVKVVSPLTKVGNCYLSVTAQYKASTQSMLDSTETCLLFMMNGETPTAGNYYDARASDYDPTTGYMVWVDACCDSTTTINNLENQITNINNQLLVIYGNCCPQSSPHSSSSSSSPQIAANCCSGAQWPEILHATLSNVSGCACLNGIVVTLTYSGTEPGFCSDTVQVWTGSFTNPCTGCGEGCTSSVTVNLICSGAGASCSEIQFIGPSIGMTFANGNFTLVSCEPPHLQFNNLSDGFGELCPGSGGFGGTFDCNITE